MVKAAIVWNKEVRQYDVTMNWKGYTVTKQYDCIEDAEIYVDIEKVRIKVAKRNPENLAYLKEVWKDRAAG